MHIKTIDIYKADIAFHEPFRIAIMEIKSAASVFIRIRTEGGLFGWGEANPTWGITGETQGTCLAAAADLAALILGKNALDIEGRMREIDRFLVHNSTVRSGFDMALYDLLGKASNLPLYAVLGGEKRVFWTDNTIGIDEPERMAEKASKFAGQGFKAIKVKLGTTRDADVERIVQIRRKIGDDLPIRIDANQGWDMTTAVQTLNALEPFGIEYCEQPVARWDMDGFIHVCRSTSIPIMADESLFDHHDAFRLAANQACHFFNIKLAKSGGIHTALKINSVAEGAGIRCMVGCMTETRLGLTAAAHLVSARLNIQYADLDGHFMLKEDPIIGGGAWNIGEITVPDSPGIGADIDPNFLERCESISVGV